jgi:hypothetical protein
MVLIQKLILISLLALILSPVVSYANPEEETMLAQARQHLDAKEYHFATTWFERLLKKYPASAHRKEVLLMISKAYLASDREEKAIKPLGTLLKEYPDVAQTLDPKLLQLAKRPPKEPSSDVQPSSAPTIRRKPAVTAAPAVAAAPAVTAAQSVAATATVNATPAPSVAASAPEPEKEKAQERVAEAVSKPEAKNPYAEALADNARDSKDPVEPPKPPAANPAPPTAPVVPAPLPRKAEPQQAPQEAPPVIEVRTAAIKEEIPPVKVPVKEASAAALPRTAARVAAPAKVAKVAKVRDRVEVKTAAQGKGGAGGIQYHAAMTGNFNLKVGQYTLKIGEYFVAAAMADDKKKVADAGLTSMVVQGPKKKTAVIRLEVEGCVDQDSAHKLLEQVQKSSGDGFIVVDKARKYHLFAGSFADQKRAEAEQQRLASLGIKSTQQKKMVDLPVLVLTAGNFATEEAAREKLKQMEKDGLHPVLVKVSRMEVTTAKR